MPSANVVYDCFQISCILACTLDFSSLFLFFSRQWLLSVKIICIIYATVFDAHLKGFVFPNVMITVVFFFGITSYNWKNVFWKYVKLMFYCNF